jgi:hypothetical protein
MKTIKHILTGEVRRVTNEEAEALRRADKLEPKAWQYCPKSEWKAQRARALTNPHNPAR